MRKFDRLYQQGQADLERRDCYDYFLFSQSVRETPQCLGLQRQVENAKKRLTRLEKMRVAATDETAQRNRQDALITELARWRCGPQYIQEARKRANDGFSFWNDSEGADPGLAPDGDGTGLGYATYRTICVRLCDGYYFPISYATVPDAFSRDANACSSQRAAPAELYYYQNPGAEVEQATSLAGVPYTQLRSAWLYRKQLVKGCSCKVAEYTDGGAFHQNVLHVRGHSRRVRSRQWRCDRGADRGRRAREHDGVGCRSVTTDGGPTRPASIPSPTPPS